MLGSCQTCRVLTVSRQAELWLGWLHKLWEGTPSHAWRTKTSKPPGKIAPQMPRTIATCLGMGQRDTNHASVQHNALPEAAWASPEAKVCKVQAARMLRKLLRQVLELVRGHVCAAHQQHLGGCQLAARLMACLASERQGLRLGSQVCQHAKLPQLLDLVSAAFPPGL